MQSVYRGRVGSQYCRFLLGDIPDGIGTATGDSPNDALNPDGSEGDTSERPAALVVSIDESAEQSRSDADLEASVLDTLTDTVLTGPPRLRARPSSKPKRAGVFRVFHAASPLQCARGLLRTSGTGSCPCSIVEWRERKTGVCRGLPSVPASRSSAFESSTSSAAEEAGRNFPKVAFTR